MNSGPWPFWIVIVFNTLRRAEYAELMALFFLQAMAMACWTVPLSAVLDAHGYTALRPFAFAASAMAAFVSPLLFGAMADRHAAPSVVLRYLCLACAGGLVLASTLIRLHAPAMVVFGAILLLNLFQAPTWSMASTIVLARLREAEREFGPIRSLATFGWVFGCLGVSFIGADSSPLAGYSSAAGWVALAALTYILPQTPPPPSATRLTLRQRMGWDALVLLKNRDHRVVFITTALFNIPQAALYPYTPPHLRDLGMVHLSAWMTLGQVTEVIAMFSLAWLFARWRVKWIFGLGIGLALVRYLLCAIDALPGLLPGLLLHGVSFTFVVITAQVYLNERVEKEYRARAQALMTLMTSGVGSLIGFLGTGAWFQACTPAGGRTQWTQFWFGLAVVTTCVFIYFLTAYRGVGRRPPVVKPVNTIMDPGSAQNP